MSLQSLDVFALRDTVVGEYERLVNCYRPRSMSCLHPSSLSGDGYGVTACAASALARRRSMSPRMSSRPSSSKPSSVSM